MFLCYYRYKDGKERDRLRAFMQEKVMIDRYYEDPSGSSVAKSSLFSFLREGDQVCVPNLCNVADSESALFDFLLGLKERKVHLCSVTEGIDTAEEKTAGEGFWAVIKALSTLHEMESSSRVSAAPAQPVSSDTKKRGKKEEDITYSALKGEPNLSFFDYMDSLSLGQVDNEE